MGTNKTQVALAAGIDIRPPDDLPITTRSQSKIGAEIVRRAAYGKVNVESITKYLDALRKCGIYQRAALAANLSYSSIRNLREKDPDFAAEEEAAKELWIAEKIDDPLYKIGIEGTTRYAINQKTGERVAVGKDYQPTIALAYARKFDRAYREKQEIDVKHGGGVVVVTAPVQPQDLEAYARKIESQNREVLDVDPKTGQVKLPTGPEQRSIETPPPPDAAQSGKVGR